MSTPRLVSAPEPAFGTVLRDIRERHLISSDLLALALKMDRSTIHRWESGCRFPKRSSVQALCDAMVLPEMERATLFAAAGFLYRPAVKVTRRSGQWALIEVAA